MRAEILMRIATLDGVHPTALNELDEVLEKQFSGNGGGKTAGGFGGPKAAAEILNLVGTAQEGTLMAQIAKVDEPLSQKLQDLMFVFEDLTEVDDRGMQELLREVPGDKLIIALKAADEKLKEKFFKNMSERAAQMMKDDLEAKGPVRLSEVEAAQKEILVTAQAHVATKAAWRSAARAEKNMSEAASPPRCGSCRRSTVRCWRAAGACADLDAIEREAWDKGYAEGREAGVAAAHAGTAGGAGRARAPGAAPGIDPGLHGQADGRARRCRCSGSWSRWPARSRARSCGASSRLQPDEIVAVIRDTVSLLPVTARDVRVHLQSRGCRSWCARGWRRPASERAWSIAEDPILPRGGCRVSSENSTIDAQLEQRLGAAIAAVLGDERSAGGGRARERGR